MTHSTYSAVGRSAAPAVPHRPDPEPLRADFAAVALTGADYAILASRLVFLVGDINVAQWLVQLGLLSVLPLLALHTLEAGAPRALWRTLKMFAMLSPVLYS